MTRTNTLAHASVALAAGVGLTLAGVGVAAAASTAPHATGPHASQLKHPALSAGRVATVRSRQQQMLATHRTAPSFSKTTSRTFTVNTTADSDLANPAGTTCVDAAGGKCSLRAAVNAADNRGTPVKIVLSARTYTLSLAADLYVSDPGGVSVVGKGSSKTTIQGDGSGLFYVEALAGSPAPTLFVTGATLTGGTASYGAGIYLSDTNNGANAVLDHVVLSDNQASQYGGAVYAADYSTLYARDSRFTGNSAPYAGAIYSYWSDVDLVGSTISGNTATSYGGGLYNEYGVVRITGGSVSHNTAAYAGALYDEYGNVAFSGTHIDDSTATGGEGGAFYLTYDLVDVTKGSLSHDHANGTDGSGGAIYAYNGTQLGLHGVTMAGDRAGGSEADGDGGGAVYAYAYEYPAQVVVDSGTKITGANSGAIYTYSEYAVTDLTIDHATLSGNHDTQPNGYSGYGCGGAVCAYQYEYGSLNLTMTSDKVTSNTSVGDVGGGAVSVYSYYYGGTSVAMRNDTFSKNSTGAGGYGGAVLLYDADEYAPISAQLSGNTFSQNKAGTSASAGEGGALAVYYYAALTDKGSTFSHNRAVGDSAYGGAVYNDSYESERFTGTTFTDNSAGAGTADGYGGAVYTDNEAGDAFTKVTMSGNKAGSYGGGIYGDSDAYEISVDSSTLSGNSAGSSSVAGGGGGIYADDSVLMLENSTVSGNKAFGSSGYGGGVYSGGSHLGIRYTTIAGNVAKQGGGLYAGADGGTVLSSIISGNHATTGGAAQNCTASSAATKPSSLGGNVLGSAGCVIATTASDKVTKNAGLKKLAKNGGPTRTMALKPSSPAVGRATYLVPSVDQRGHKRPKNHADAGAYELPAKK